MRVWVIAGAAPFGGGLGFDTHNPNCLRIFLTGDSIAQNVVVSDSTFGSILPEIRNIALARARIFYIRKKRTGKNIDDEKTKESLLTFLD